MAEKKFYLPVKNWLTDFLESRYKRYKIRTFDTSRVELSNFIASRKLTTAFPGSNMWEIKVDITGFITDPLNRCELVFVEVKEKPIVLKDIGQLLGYCKIAGPLIAFIISPNWISRKLNTLFELFGRNDVLEYAPGRLITICDWDTKRRTINTRKIIPAGTLKGIPK